MEWLRPAGPRIKAATSDGDPDRIGGLPDAVLQHILGFLPADEAVRTSVLARQWRYLWRSMRRLRINNEGRLQTADYLKKFMDGLLLVKDPDVALDQVEFREIPFLDEDHVKIEIWIRHVLLCKLQELSLYLPPEDRLLVGFEGPALASRHLRKLKLSVVYLEGSFLDFVTCPVLEYLEIIDCLIDADRILSQSLKHLIIKDVGVFGRRRIHISAPSLILLQLRDIHGKSPLLEDMPSLETAVFQFGSEDYCRKGSAWGCRCAKCFKGDDGGQDSCILILGVFSSAINLELIIDSGMLILSRWCPTFSRLKTLLLPVREKVNDLQWMVCILEHSPILEKLTITIPKVQRARKLERSHQATEQLSVISERLNAVEIKCGQVDEMVYKILKLLDRFVKEININLTDQP